MKKTEKVFWKTYFGISNPSLAPQKIKRLNWKDQNITDEEVYFLCERVKDIYQMDLDNNLVTNIGIMCLSRLTIEELRLKGLNINDDAIKYIQKISGLKFLHIGGTNISSEGIGGLRHLNTLETLICSPYPVNPLPLRRFKESLPQCELIVNYELFEG